MSGYCKDCGNQHCVCDIDAKIIQWDFYSLSNMGNKYHRVLFESIYKRNRIYKEVTVNQKDTIGSPVSSKVSTEYFISGYDTGFKKMETMLSIIDRDIKAQKKDKYDKTDT